MRMSLRRKGGVARIISVLMLSGFILSCPGYVEAQTWNGSISDLWGTAGNWTPSTVPNSSTASAVITNATNNPVLINVSPTIANLTIGGANSASLDNGNSLTIAGGASAGSLDIAGNLIIGSTGSFTDLILGGASGSTITLSGGGILSLSNNFNNRIYSTAGDTLLNSAGNTIQGSGQIGINNGGFGFTLNNAGTINANQSAALQIAPTNAVTNTGTLEATSGGTLHLIGTFTNTSGVIQSTGSSSVVELNGSTINNGTLTTSSGGTLQNSGSATLNGVTVSSGSTFTAVNGSGTTIEGTVTNNGTILLNSTGSFTDLILSGTLSLTGGGPLTMSNSFNNRIYGTAIGATLNNPASNTIQGSGQIGINNGGFAFTLNNAGTINANQSAGLMIAPTNAVTNTGTLEATSGATLDLIGTFTNTGGVIKSTGTNSVVELNGSTINNGTLTTSSGGTVQNNGNATLDGVTVSSGSTFTAVNGSGTTMAGTVTNNGTILLNSTGSFTDLILSGTLSLTGGGPLTMSNSFNNRIYGTAIGATLNNPASNTIQGSGQIGINNGGFAFTLNNAGTINANQSAGLMIAPTNTVTNTGTLEATSGGTLELIGTFTNTGGVIKATGTNSVVELNGSTINNGTLTTSSGGTLENGGTATLNGVTVSSGSTVTLLNGTTTDLKNTITNNGTIALNSTGSFTDLRLNGAVNLTGGGTLAMSNSFNNRVYGITGSDSLINDANHTVEGAGELGINNGGFGFTLTNNGRIVANQSNPLSIAPSGNTTNNGTFQANSGSTLFMNGTLTNYNPTTNTLTGGTYNALSGTIELSQASAPSKVIATNAATILLDGSTAKIADSTGADVLRGFLTTNTAAGSFTIQNGANLTTASTGFTNAGLVNIGANSKFTVGGTNDYIQSGGATALATASSVLAVASGHSVDANGGTIQGFGTIQGNLINAGGTILPGTSGTAGILTVTGTYSDPMGGDIDFQIGGLAPGTEYSKLDMDGTASLTGSTFEVSLIGGFTPLSGATFDVLNSAGLGGTTFQNSTVQLNGLTFTASYINNDTDVLLTVTGGSVTGTPLPTSVWGGLVLLASLGVWRAVTCRTTPV